MLLAWRIVFSWQACRRASIFSVFLLLLKMNACMSAETIIGRHISGTDVTCKEQFINRQNVFLQMMPCIVCIMITFQCL